MSAINEPHPDSKPEDEAELFFGGEGETVSEPLAPAFDPVSQTLTDPEEADPTPAEEGGTTGSTTEPDPSPAESAGPTEPEAADGDPTPASPEPSAASDANGAKKSGALEREYLVFHKLPLTEKALKFLLKEIEEGKAPEPRVAFFPLHTTTTRNVNAAISEAYTTHRSLVGEKADLAAVSERSFQQRHVEPKQKVETNLSIT